MLRAKELHVTYLSDYCRMGKKDKKKGKGAEKAQAKALKKASKKEEGLDELEALIKTYQEQDAKANTVAETAMEQPPSQR